MSMVFDSIYSSLLAAVLVIPVLTNPVIALVLATSLMIALVYFEMKRFPFKIPRYSEDETLELIVGVYIGGPILLYGLVLVSMLIGPVAIAFSSIVVIVLTPFARYGGSLILDIIFYFV